MQERKRFVKPVALSGIVAYALKRHGFERQVTASMIVQTVREEVPKMVEPHVLNDVRVVSFSGGNLTISCKNGPAIDYMVTKRAEIKNLVESAFPTITLKNIYCNIRPQDFDEML
ncbi:hypothetical protein KJ766_02680 [Patescibacteria group bacterium]|nr:hypothetical protein [Patescibacteria group bacterium]